MAECGRWDLVLLNAVLFGLFILFIPFKKRVGCPSASAYLAFIIALYAEMYGFPLTIYILAWLFGYQNPSTQEAGNLLGMAGGLLGIPMSYVGAILLLLGWGKIHTAKGELVTDGLYGHIRHPQYLGILLLTIGMLIHWTTLPTLLMWPILVTLYYRLAKEEEKEMEEKFGERYRKYKKKVPMFLPFIKLDRSQMIQQRKIK